ncbi:hypothetical protein TIFTF001_000286 [Ficus carica]|uniref:Uncharacterized protein n=1 Tax=Ficus carica TaxID=3494 RepID=A0AA88CNW5_FICCA|nr:hypothetical protein TIFTF001_000286 [Ficus carica]
MDGRQTKYQVARTIDQKLSPCASTHNKTGREMHTPYAGIILFRFKGTVSAWLARLPANFAGAKQNTGTPGASLMSAE